MEITLSALWRLGSAVLYNIAIWINTSNQAIKGPWS
jgi:hypothetical protein